MGFAQFLCRGEHCVAPPYNPPSPHPWKTSLSSLLLSRPTSSSDCSSLSQRHPWLVPVNRVQNGHQEEKQHSRLITSSETVVRHTPPRPPALHPAKTHPRSRPASRPRGRLEALSSPAPAARQGTPGQQAQRPPRSPQQRQHQQPGRELLASRPRGRLEALSSASTSARQGTPGQQAQRPPRSRGPSSSGTENLGKAGPPGIPPCSRRVLLGYTPTEYRNETDLASQ